MTYNLTEIAPNAHYDNINGKPAVLYHDNDGSTIFRMNIVEETDDEGNVGWACYEIRTFKQPTKGNIKHDLIRSLVDECKEFELVNKFNMSKTGVLKNKDAETTYKSYLQMLCDIDDMLVEVLQ